MGFAKAYDAIEEYREQLMKKVSVMPNDLKAAFGDIFVALDKISDIEETIYKKIFEITFDTKTDKNLKAQVLAPNKTMARKLFRESHVQGKRAKITDVNFYKKVGK